MHVPRSYDSTKSWDGCIAVLRPALLLAPRSYLDDMRDRLFAEGIQDAVAARDTGAIFDWIVRLLDRQGISNAAAISYAERHGSARWSGVTFSLTGRPICSKLKSYWHFADCQYRKERETCARTELLPLCPLPMLPGRKGGLNQAAFGLALFLRDVCNGDIVSWIDGRLAAVDPGEGASNRAILMRDTLIEPLANIAGTGWKTWSMILAELLLGADPLRERWITTGASFVAIDSLVHAYLHRTGILRRLHAEHHYGASCYARGGCADVIAGLAARIDAREFNANYPACFPRWIQFATWRFCAADGWSICNSNKINDGGRCAQKFCPTYPLCDRLSLN